MLDPDNLKVYRPVSNVTLIYKLVEKAVASQFYEHLEGYGLLAKMQSVYSPKYHVETA